MKAHPLVAVLLVVIGLAALEAMLPVWPEVRAQPTGLATGGADLVDALRSDLEVLRQRGALDLLRAIDGGRWVVVSVLLGLIIAAAWLSRRYLAAPDDHAAS
jgi:hypothetical protein